jgi:membrane-associated phospholipid phosphatase
MDARIFRWFNRLADHTVWAHGIARFFADYGVVLFAALLLVAYLDARRSGDQRGLAGAVWSGGAAMVALGIGQLIGGTIDRARPYTAIANVHTLVDRTTDFSFPSDHATMAGAVGVGLLLAARRWRWLALGAAVVMAVTRVYVGAHYLSDVIAGLALGGVVVVAGRYLVMPLLERVVTRLSTSKARRLVTALVQP